MKNKLAFLVMTLLCSGVSFAGEQHAWKFEGYRFAPNYGYGVQRNISVAYGIEPFYTREYNLVASIVSDNYGYERKSVKAGGVFPYQIDEGFVLSRFVELKDGVIVFRGVVDANQITGNVTCKDATQCPNGKIFAVADSTQNDLRVLDYDDISIENFSKSQNPVRVYGCYHDNPLQAADINDDGEPEVLMFSGFGRGQTDVEDAFLGYEDASYWFDGGVKLTILSGKNYAKSVLNLMMYDAKFTLGTENSSLNNLSPRHPRYHFVSRPSDPHLPFSDWPIGYQEAAKLYVADIDKNNRMDVIVWYRKYISNNVDNQIIGFHFESERFERYEESVSGDFVRVPITNEESRMVMQEQKWDLSNGFPNKDYCDYSPSFPDKDPSLMYLDNVYGIGKLVD